MNKDDLILVYVTAPTLESAREIGRIAVERKHAACANILPQMQSIYSWKGQMCEENEVVLLLKTQRERFTQLKETILAHHPYECPCILALEIADGHQPFLEWLRVQSSNS